MSRLRLNSTSNTIEEIIHKMILSWLEGHAEDIYGMLDDDVVMYVPQCRDRIVGKERFIAVLRNIQEQSNIKKYDEHDFTVTTREGVAIAHYRFRIDYEINGNKRCESGIDFLIFAEKAGSWRLVRRSVILSS